MEVIGKKYYKSVCACILNTQNFRRMLYYNPSVAFSQTFLTRIFQDYHISGAKVCWKSGQEHYTNFILKGKLETLQVEFPMCIKSPILNIPSHLMSHDDVRLAQNEKLNELLLSLFPYHSQPREVITTT